MEKIIVETIESLNEYLPKLKEGGIHIAESLQTGELKELIDQLSLFFEGLQWVIEAVNGLEQNGYHLDIEKVEITNYLNEMESALKNEDYGLLGDLLEYEITPIISKWITVLKGIKM